VFIGRLHYSFRPQAEVSGLGVVEDARRRWDDSVASERLRRFRLIVVAALAGVATLATASVALAGERARALPGVQRALDEVVAAGAPGAIALVRDGDRAVRLSSGYRNLAPKTPIHVGDRFRIGGLTKTFTATVVLQLVGEGKVALDDTVERWLPGVISNGEAISVRQLLNHTSGIFSFDQDPRVFAPYLEDLPNSLTLVFDPREGVRIAAEHGPVFAPGSGLLYSNTNYLLLAMIVEAATGTSFGSELRERIFEPLRLHHTSYPSSSRINGSYIHGYFLLDESMLLDITPLSPTLFGAAGGIVSTAKDVARFYRALLRGRLLAPEQLEAMQTIDPVATGGVPDAGFPGGGWGLGLLRETFPCGREAWGHDSEFPGYVTAAWNSKDGTRQVVVVANRVFEPDEPATQALREVLAEAYCRR
jgi:D-alanyl-D-alanine carboxypeptidase